MENPGCSGWKPRTRWPLSKVSGSGGIKHPHATRHSHRCRAQSLGAAHPPIRRCPALAGSCPLTCTPAKLCPRRKHPARLPPTLAPWSAPRAGHRGRPAASPTATGSPPARHARPQPQDLEASPRTSREGREQGARTPTRGARAAPARTPAPQPHRNRQQQQQPCPPDPRHPCRRCLRPATLSTPAPAPAAPSGPTATAASQPLPASEFPVPRLPKHAHQAERGGREEMLAGSRSLQQGWAGGL